MKRVILNDRYTIEHLLGQGAMGIVYRARDEVLDRPVAIKVFETESFGDSSRVRFLEEAKHTAQLSHPNIVTVHDAGEHEGAPFIVMELVDGRTLGEHQPESFDETLTLSAQLCRALAHAHAAGIIHRDIKPDNVMVCLDGTAKLMDFGIARSAASRLTEDGAFLGTLHYIAPEQAIGAEIDARADLYSLGVLLYELCTGHLPFEAADALAVITQHIHAPPVPPRAKNPEVPPALDELILALIEKKPEARPRNAEEVLERLEAIQKATAAGDAPAQDYRELDRIVRGRMVGREAELEEARALWRQAMAGEGGLLLVSGEPGIGKSRFIQEMITHAEVTGGQSLVGESYAKGGAPYGAFTQILRRILLEDSDQVNLPAFVVADLLSLAPDLQPHFPEIPPNPSLDPKSAQQRLFENAVTFIKTLCASQPLLLVFEDVHWADGGTLSVVRHLARRTKEERVLLTATYREADLDSALPFAGVLEDFNREHLGVRVKLKRLDEHCTEAMLKTLFEEEITPEFLAGIFNETEGNPFFVEELVRALVDSGALYFKDGIWHRPPIEELDIPQGIRVAIQSRLDKLAPPVQDALCMAAVLGRHFEFETLKEASVNGADEDALIEALEIAESVQVIQEIESPGHNVMFRFSHALITTTLVESVKTLRRRRLHRRAAAAIEIRYPDDYDALAHHWAEAGDAERSLAYTKKAAERARATYALEDAVERYSQVLEELPGDHPDRFGMLNDRQEVFGILSRFDEARQDIDAMLAWADRTEDEGCKMDSLLALSSFYRATTTDRMREPAQQVLSIARKRNDRPRQARALFLLGSMHQHFGEESKGEPYLREAVEIYREQDLPVELAGSLSMLALVVESSEEKLLIAQEALAQSKLVGDPHRVAVSMRRLGIGYMTQHKYEQALTHVEGALLRFREIGDIVQTQACLNVLGLIKTGLGRLDEAESDYLEGLNYGLEYGQLLSVAWIMGNLAWLRNTYLADHEKHLLLVEELLALAQRLGDDFLTSRMISRKKDSLYFLGDFRSALALMEEHRQLMEKQYSPAGFPGKLSWMALYSGEIGDKEKTRLYIEEAESAAAACGEKAVRMWVCVLNSFAKIQLHDGRWELADLNSLLVSAREAVAYFRELDRADGGLGVSLSLEALVHLYLHEQGMPGVEEALACISEADKIYRGGIHFDVPLFHYGRMAEIHLAAGKEGEASEYIRQAHDWLMQAAGNIQDPARRWVYLNEAKDHVRVKTLFEERFGEMPHI